MGEEDDVVEEEVPEPVCVRGTLGRLSGPWPDMHAGVYPSG